MNLQLARKIAVSIIQVTTIVVEGLYVLEKAKSSEVLEDADDKPK